MAKTKAKPEKNKNNKFYKQTKKQTSKQNKEEENTHTKINGPQDSLQKKINNTNSTTYRGEQKKRQHMFQVRRSFVGLLLYAYHLSGLGCTDLN